MNFLLDCIDREMPYFGTERAREEPEKLLQYCVEKLENEWRTQMYRYFYFNVNEIEPYIEDMVEQIKSLVRNCKGILEECVGEIANEKEMKATLEGGERKLESIQEGVEYEYKYSDYSFNMSDTAFYLRALLAAK